MTESTRAHPAAELRESVECQGTTRHEVLHRIGAGGMGVVYEVRDRQGGEPLALKTLLRFSPADLYRFKQEFRILADVRHRNLVRLHELVVTDSAQAFFVMELVHGTDFVTDVQRVRSRETCDRETSDRPTRVLWREGAESDAPPSGPPRGSDTMLAAPVVLPATPVDFDKLRDLGPMALHVVVCPARSPIWRKIGRTR